MQLYTMTDREKEASLVSLVGLKPPAAKPYFLQPIVLYWESGIMNGGMAFNPRPDWDIRLLRRRPNKSNSSRMMTASAPSTQLSALGRERYHGFAALRRWKFGSKGF
jgi:hypothetical protein